MPGRAECPDCPWTYDQQPGGPSPWKAADTHERHTGCSGILILHVPAPPAPQQGDLFTDGTNP